MNLTIVIDVDHDLDPSLTDPHEIAESILGSYQVDRRCNGYADPAVSFVSAEWAEG